MDYFKRHADLADNAEILSSRGTGILYSITRNQSKRLVFSVKTTIFAPSNLVLTLNPITMDQLDNIQNCIFEFRGQRVMLDRDLAAMYGVETKALNQAVKRNAKRFEGDDFMFRLTKDEATFARSRSQVVTLESPANKGLLEDSASSRSQIVTMNKGPHRLHSGRGRIENETTHLPVMA